MLKLNLSMGNHPSSQQIILKYYLPGTLLGTKEGIAGRDSIYPG